MRRWQSGPLSRRTEPATKTGEPASPPPSPPPPKNLRSAGPRKGGRRPRTGRAPTKGLAFRYLTRYIFDTGGPLAQLDVDDGRAGLRLLHFGLYFLSSVDRVDDRAELHHLAHLLPWLDRCRDRGHVFPDGSQDGYFIIASGYLPTRFPFLYGDSLFLLMGRLQRKEIHSQRIWRSRQHDRLSYAHWHWFIQRVGVFFHDCQPLFIKDCFRHCVMEKVCQHERQSTLQDNSCLELCEWYWRLSL